MNTHSAAALCISIIFVSLFTCVSLERIFEKKPNCTAKSKEMSEWVLSCQKENPTMGRDDTWSDFCSEEGEKIFCIYE
jgi:hypothetical protein